MYSPGELKKLRKKLEHGYRLHERYHGNSVFVLPDRCFKCGSDVEVVSDGHEERGFCPVCLFVFQAVTVYGYEEPYFKQSKKEKGA